VTPKLFISYRRDDAAAAAGRLFDRLIQFMPRENIFMDVDSIGAGENFRQRIEDAITQCSVFLPIIGRSWLSASDASGRPRLHDPNDVVRIEIATALDRYLVHSSGEAKVIVPVLVDGARMPDAVDLPADIKLLAQLHALELRHSRYDEDFEYLRSDLADTAVFELHMMEIRKRLFFRRGLLRGNVEVSYGWRQIRRSIVVAFAIGAALVWWFGSAH
jgi:hypothetical protein